MKIENLELDLRPEDRVLSLSVPPVESIGEIAAALEAGGLVSLGKRDDVYEARRRVRDYHNVMLHPGPPEEIPFDDAWFTKIFDLQCEWDDPAKVAREVARALADGGRAYLAAGDSEHFTTAGLRRVSDDSASLVFERPRRPRPDAPPLELPIVR